MINIFISLSLLGVVNKYNLKGTSIFTSLMGIPCKNWKKKKGGRGLTKEN